MIRMVLLILHALHTLVRTRAAVAIEVAALRHQLEVLKAKRPRPHLTNSDRAFWIAVRRLWSGWTNALVIVKPETVVRWPERLSRLLALEVEAKGRAPSGG